MREPYINKLKKKYFCYFENDIKISRAIDFT